MCGFIQRQVRSPKTLATGLEWSAGKKTPRLHTCPLLELAWVWSQVDSWICVYASVFEVQISIPELLMTFTLWTNEIIKKKEKEKVKKTQKTHSGWINVFGLTSHTKVLHIQIFMGIIHNNTQVRISPSIFRDLQGRCLHLLSQVQAFTVRIEKKLLEWD